MKSFGLRNQYIWITEYPQIFFIDCHFDSLLFIYILRGFISPKFYQNHESKLFFIVRCQQTLNYQNKNFYRYMSTHGIIWYMSKICPLFKYDHNNIILFAWITASFKSPLFCDVKKSTTICLTVNYTSPHCSVFLRKFKQFFFEK